MAVAAPAAEKLDAICVGGSVEVLFAAACLVAAGKSVAVFGGHGAGGPDDVTTPCLVDVDAAMRLDLVAHGLRFGAPVPLIGVSPDRTLVLWPDRDATTSSLGALSAHDAAAWPGFAQRVLRLAAQAGDVATTFVPNLHLAALGRDPLLDDTMFLRGASLARVLGETFQTPLLQGMLCQRALEGTGVNPTVPGSARLLARLSVLSLLRPAARQRRVAGGVRAVTASLVAALGPAGAAGVLREGTVSQILFEREAVQGVVLADGTSLRAPHVIMSPVDGGTRDLLLGGPFDLPPVVASVPAGKLLFDVSMPPSLRGVSPAVLAQGASVLLNPSIDRLMRSHAAFARRSLLEDFCLCLRARPLAQRDGRVAWQVAAEIPFVPRALDEGPWSGSRRERLIAAVTKTIDAWAPGFELSLQGAELVHPAPPRGFLDQERPALALSTAQPAVEVLPDVGHDGVHKPARGLWLAACALSGGAGQAGASIASALGAASRSRMMSDA